MLKIRRPLGRLIFNMRLSYLVRPSFLLRRPSGLSLSLVTLGSINQSWMKSKKLLEFANAFRGFWTVRVDPVRIYIGEDTIFIAVSIWVIRTPVSEDRHCPIMLPAEVTFIADVVKANPVTRPYPLWNGVCIRTGNRCWYPGCDIIWFNFYRSADK